VEENDDDDDDDNDEKVHYVGFTVLIHISIPTDNRTHCRCTENLIIQSNVLHFAR
jgi:hypothetical protein